jgi:hypothetical protein
MDEVIKWIDAKKEMPDSDLNVLMFGSGHESATGQQWEVWVGYWDADSECWRNDLGGRAGVVTHWAEMPEGPKVTA